MDHVNIEIQQSDSLHHRPGEEHEPLAIVRIVLAVLAIELIAVVVGILLDQVDRNRAVGQVTPQEAPGNRFVADGDDEFDSQRFDRQSAIPRLPIGGQV